MCKVERGARKVKCDMFNVTLSEAAPLVSLIQGDNIFLNEKRKTCANERNTSLLAIAQRV